VAQPLGGPKQRALLAALLLSPNRRVGLSRLAALLWEVSPRSGTANLRTYATGLRKVLADRLVAREGGYELVVAAGESDVERFAELVARGRGSAAAGELGPARDCFEEALGLWRGGCGEDLARDMPLQRHLRVLDEERLRVVEDCMQVRLELGEGQTPVVALRSLLSDHPTRERLWGQLMTALYRCGDVSGALDAYRDAAAVLDEQLGVQPGAELRELQQAVLVRDPALDASTGHRDAAQDSAGAATGGACVVPRQLPMDSQVLLGRDAEADAILAVCAPQGRDQARPVVVALDGQGGIGKSALALRVAHRLASEHSDGQLYVDLQGSNTGLEPVSEVQVMAAFLRALGDHPASLSLEEMAGRFRTMAAGRHLLVLLDNAADTHRLELLLPADPRCTVLVTSRKRLVTLDASLRLSLDTLPMPVACAVLAAFGGGRTSDAGADVARVAELCAGLPLALRMAAARLALRTDWSAADLAERLADDRRRLDELGTDRLSVRATMAATYEALVHADRTNGGCSAQLFRLMGVVPVPTYSDGLLAALADLTVAELEPAVQRLVSLHVVEPRNGRYVVHDLLRLFATDLARRELSDQERRGALGRAYSYYADASCRAAGQLRPVRLDVPADLQLSRNAPRLRCTSVDDARAWFDAERDSLLAVAHRATDNAELLGGPAMAIIVALLTALETDGWLVEAITLNEVMVRLARAQADRRSEARAWTQLATLQQRVGDPVRARQDIQRGIELYRVADDTLGLAKAINALGIFLTEAGRFIEGGAHLRQALELFRSEGDELGTGLALNSIGMNLRWRGENTSALTYLAESLAVRRELGDRVGEIYTLMQMGSAHAAEDELDDALALFDDVVRLAVDIGARDLERQGRMFRLQVLIRLGRIADADADLNSALELCQITGYPDGRLLVLAAAAAPDIDPERVAALATNGPTAGAGGIP
jgi:DNA-binding SARP family transcriptional activator